MKTVLKKLDFLQAILEVTLSNGKIYWLEIVRTNNGHSYSDISGWDITHVETFDLEEEVESIIERMKASYWD